MPGSATTASPITASPPTARWPWPAPTWWCRRSAASSAPGWRRRPATWRHGTTWSAWRRTAWPRPWRPARYRLPRWAAAWTRTWPISWPRPRRAATPRPCWADRPGPGRSPGLTELALRRAEGAQDAHHEHQGVRPLDARLRVPSAAEAVLGRDDGQHPAAHLLPDQGRFQAGQQRAGEQRGLAARLERALQQLVRGAAPQVNGVVANEGVGAGKRLPAAVHQGLHGELAGGLLRRDIHARGLAETARHGHGGGRGRGRCGGAAASGQRRGAQQGESG